MKACLDAHLPHIQGAKACLDAHRPQIHRANLLDQANIEIGERGIGNRGEGEGSGECMGGMESAGR